MSPVIPSDVAFTPAVKAVQERLGSRAAYARMERRGGWETEITEGLADFIGQQVSFYIATSNAENQPYIQHRGGPKGFLQVLDPTTLAFADFRGNRQYISMGNLADNPKVHLFLMDYANRSRVKIWGTCTVVEDDPALLAKLTLPDYDARVERAFVIRVTAWDANCPQHIPQRFEAADAPRGAGATVAEALARRDRRIADLEAQLAALR